MDTTRIAQQLSTIEGFKQIFTGFMGGGKAKKSFAVYSSSSVKGVFPLYTLHTTEYEDCFYAVFAFDPSGNINGDNIKDLTSRVTRLGLGSIRSESLSYSCLEPWRGDAGSHADTSCEISGIAPDYPNIFIFAVAEFNAAKVTCPCVIYAKKDNDDYIYPLTEKQAAVLLA